MEGFILGLTNGTICAAYCIPALISYLLKEGKQTKQNFIILAQFMLGRFIGYFLFSILAWLISVTIFEDSNFKDLFFGITYIMLAILLVFKSKYDTHPTCATKSLRAKLQSFSSVHPLLIPLLIGFITGLNICPPFLLAFTRATATGTLLGSIIFFVTFFLGTSIYFLPTPLIGFLSKYKKILYFGKIFVILISIFYLALGTMMILKSLGINNFDIMKFQHS